MLASRWEAEVYVGVAPRAGVGATTTLLNLAHAAAKEMKTLYIDLDILNPGATALLGLERENSYWNVLVGSSTSDSFVHRVGSLDVMPFYVFRPREMSRYLNEEEEIINKILETIIKLRKSYDVIFIDTLPRYTISSIKVWQEFEHLIGVGNYNIQSLSALLQVNEIFREWSKRNLSRGFECLIFNDTGNHTKIDERVLRELFVGTTIYSMPYTKEFYSSSAIAKNDAYYVGSIKKILESLGIIKVKAK